MQQRALSIGAQCQVQRRDPDDGGRNFGCYRTWAKCMAALSGLSTNSRHLFEIIPHGKRCKPYLDLDGDALPPGIASIDEVVDRTTALIRRVFQEDYGVALADDAIVWLHSGNQTKVSLHLVVSSHAPQYVYHSNHQDDPQGAFHLAARLRQLDPDGVGGLVDAAVYTRDREFRTVGSTKFEKKQSVLLTMRSDVDVRDTIITWLDTEAEGGVVELNVPLHIPRAVKAAGRGFTNPREAKGQAMAAHDTRDNAHAGYVRGRMLELLQSTIHPSAYHDRGHGHGLDDPYDAQRGVKFNYRCALAWDGAEPPQSSGVPALSCDTR
jgi:hypothetical protein